MSLPHQIAAYEDCFQIFEAAKADPKGARACMVTQSAAFRMRMRMNMARYLHRLEAIRMYDSTDQRYGKSEFDSLKITLQEDEIGEWWVYVEPHGQDIAIIQPLSTV